MRNSCIFASDWKSKERGHTVVPSFIEYMSDIIEKIHAYLEPMLEGSDMFVVNIKIKPTNNIKVYLDSDSGFSIEKSSSVNRKLYAAIEAEGLYPDGNFSLEVSSPGIDEPLNQIRQYKKNVGRKVTVTDTTDKETTGMMKEVTDEYIRLEIKGKKHKEVSEIEIPFSNIKKTVVQIIF